MKNKEFEVWKKVLRWEVSTVLAIDEEEAEEKYLNGSIEATRTEDYDESNGEYEIQEKEKDEN